MLALIIDDDIDDIDILKELLYEIDETLVCLGYVASDAAIAAIGELKPNYIFLDYNMPKVTGRDILSKLRDDKEFDGTVIIAMSTSMDNDLAKILIDEGANYALEKPCNIEQFIAVLKGILNHK